MAKLTSWSDEDLRVIRKVVDIVLSQKGVLRPNTEASNAEDSFAPELYVALPQSSTGISGMTKVGTGSFAPPSEGDIPGSGLCDIYQLVVDSGNPQLMPIGADQKVYNLSEEQITRDWIFVTRDKFGVWWAFNEISETIWRGVAQSSAAKGAYFTCRRSSNNEDETVLAELGTVSSGSICYVSMIDGEYRVVNTECPV